MVEAIAWFAALGVTAIANIATQRIRRPLWSKIMLNSLQAIASLGLLWVSFTNNTVLSTLSVLFVVLMSVGVFYGRPTR